ncbi:MAG: hypothetical protein KZQ91_03375 [Candidatus Thiodiazotropha sp. (ex Lucinoma borealis)]|nr:hypothetical protein [Candidatus Thiodiazotropha sp. (ex Lucinoma borealis)]
MHQVRDVSINVLDVNQAIGRKVGDNWQGMTSIEGPQADAAINVLSSSTLPNSCPYKVPKPDGSEASWLGS